MTVIALCSAKHSPGVTTLALALSAAWSSMEDVTLVEADPAGGDIAARAGLPVDPGLVSLAAAARHPTAPLDVSGNARSLPCGGEVILGPTDTDQAEAAVATIASRLPGALRQRGNGVVDCGRWSRSAAVTEIIRRADWTLLVVRPDIAGIAHAQQRLQPLAAAAGGRLFIVAIGDRPYRQADIAQATGVGVMATIAIDRDGADALVGGAGRRVARSSALIRSARSVLEALSSLTQAVPA